LVSYIKKTNIFFLIYDNIIKRNIVESDVQHHNPNLMKEKKTMQICLHIL